MPVSPFVLPFICLASFVITLYVTALARKMLLRNAVMDKPNERSMHKAPVPRGGGLAVMAVVTAGLAALFHDFLAAPSHGYVLLAALILTGVSWLDDRRGLHIVPRFAVHVFSAYLGSLALPQESFLFNGLLPFWAERFLLIVGWAWFINLYNFMDGIDGIAGIETLCLAVGAGAVFSLIGTNDYFLFTLVALLAGASCAFLVFNWHPAKIFLGDVGSIPLGFLTGFLLLQIAAEGYRVAALILPLYYLVDSGITLTRRIARGEKFWRPHREHYYQRAAQGVGRHDRVVLWILTTNIVLIVAACVGTQHFPAGTGLAAVSVALLLVKMHKSAPR